MNKDFKDMTLNELKEYYNAISDCLLNNIGDEGLFKSFMKMREDTENEINRREKK